MMTLRILAALVATVIGLAGSINDENYEQKAKEYYEEAQENVNEQFNDETKEELEKKGIIIEAVTVSYKRNENYDNAYTFRADVVVNGHTVSEILVVDMRDDTDLEYYGLVDNELMTAEKSKYYHELLSTN